VRNWVAAAQLGDNQKPALMMLEEDEDLQRQRAGMPPRRMIMKAQLIIINSSAGLTIPSQALDPQLDALDTILAPTPNGQPNYRQTLGNIAYDAWISGRIQKIPGYRDGIAVAVIPINVLVP
jgi:hypothetical protein